jgi:hypothetical protein
MTFQRTTLMFIAFSFYIAGNVQISFNFNWFNLFYLLVKTEIGRLEG